MQPDDLRYPIGKFQSKETYTEQDIAEYISRIERLPQKLTLAIAHLNDQQLDTPYRDGGWTVRQVIHHVSDSHMHAYIRVKWALTENAPVIKAYAEKLWAETPETKLSIDISLELIKALHAKWIALMKRIPFQDLKRRFIHPETKKEISLQQLLGTYAWHGEHHLAHITSLKDRNGWK
jgi:hypothetical protein